MAKSDAAKIAEALEHEVELRRAEGRREVLVEMTGWLQARFMRDDIAIDDPEGQAIRTLAGELVEAFGEDVAPGDKTFEGTDV